MKPEKQRTKVKFLKRKFPHQLLTCCRCTPEHRLVSSEILFAEPAVWLDKQSISETILRDIRIKKNRKMYKPTPLTILTYSNSNNNPNL